MLKKLGVYTVCFLTIVSCCDETVVGSADKKSPGQGTVEENGTLIALLTGVVSEIDGVVSVHTYNEMLRVQVGDNVIGEVVKLNEKSGEIRILSVEGKPNRSVMADQEYAQFHVTKITRTNTRINPNRKLYS